MIIEGQLIHHEFMAFGVKFRMTHKCEITFLGNGRVGVAWPIVKLSPLNPIPHHYARRSG
jgi:hypothetical protein